jgi:UPF0755 protein
VLTALIAVPALAGFLYLKSIGVLAASEKGPKVEIVIPKGSNAQQIGELLEAEGVIRSAMGFRIAIFLNKGDENFQAGRYEIATGLSARDALDALLESGPLIESVSVTFPEGKWMTDFARILGEETDIDADAFLRLVQSRRLAPAFVPQDVHMMEGLLFPSTYQVDENDNAETVARRLRDEMVQRIDDLDLAGIEDRGYSPYEVLIVASMVEAEAKVPEDRAKIATVIYNRLEKRIPLGIDATVLYALGEHKTELTVSDLQVDSPYNTRIVSGLPPTPIGAPGQASLEAAATPADGDWLYFVLTDCAGHHSFSTQYGDFLRDKATYESLSC